MCVTCLKAKVKNFLTPFPHNNTLRWRYGDINNIHSLTFFYIISIFFLVLIPSFDYYIISMVFNFDKKFKTIACINQELLE